MLAVAHPIPWSSASFYLPSQGPLPILAATFMPPRGLPTLVVLSLCRFFLFVASLSSASFCDGAAACRSLALASRRNSALSRHILAPRVYRAFLAQGPHF